MENPEANIEIFCRSCLTSINDCESYSLANHNILVNQQTHEWKSLAQIYEECAHIRFELANSLWQWICHGCLQKFVEFYDFQRTCISSFKRLCEGNVVKLEPEKTEIKANIEIEDHLEGVLDCFGNLVECDYCQRRFTSKNNLVEHMRIHKSSTAQVCDKKYKMKVF